MMMGKGATKADALQGCQLALDLSSTAVTLFSRAGSRTWSPIGDAVLGADDFSEQIDALRVEALVRGDKQDNVLLWLPPEQVITRNLQLAPGSEDAARSEATQRIADDTDFDPSELTVAMADGDAPNETVVMGALLQTVHEAQEYGTRWGFPNTLVSTRCEDGRFGPDGPVFAPPPTIVRQAGHAVRRLAFAATIALAFCGTVYGGYNALQPLLEEPADIRSSGPALASFSVVLDPITPDRSPIQQVRFGGVGSLAIQRLLVPDTDRLTTYGVPLHEGPFATQQPSELASPGEGAPMQVGGAPVHPTYERPGRLSAVASTSSPPDAEAVRAAIQRIRLAGPDDQDAVAVNAEPATGTDQPGNAPVDAERVAALTPTVAVPDNTSDAPLQGEGPAGPVDTAPSEDNAAPTEPEAPEEEPAATVPAEEQSALAPVAMNDQPAPRPQDLAAKAIAADEAARAAEAAAKAEAQAKAEEAAKAEAAAQAAAARPAPSDTAPNGSIQASLVPSTVPTDEPNTEPEVDPNAPTVFAALKAPAPSKRPRVFERAAKRPVSTRPAVSAVNVPRTVRSAARKVGLELDETSLIGVIDARSGRRALVRMPSGDYRKVAKGDDLDGWRVNSISREAMRLTRRGQNRTLLLVSR